MTQFDAVAVGDAQDGRLRQEALRPGPVRGEEPEEARALGQRGEQLAIIAAEPAIEGALPRPFARVEQRQSHDLAGVQLGLRMLRLVAHDLVHPAEQRDDKLLGRHASLLGAAAQTPTASRGRMPPSSTSTSSYMILAYSAWPV